MIDEDPTSGMSGSELAEHLDCKLECAEHDRDRLGECLADCAKTMRTMMHWHKGAMSAEQQHEYLTLIGRAECLLFETFPPGTDNSLINLPSLPVEEGKTEAMLDLASKQGLIVRNFEARSGRTEISEPYSDDEVIRLLDEHLAHWRLLSEGERVFAVKECHRSIGKGISADAYIVEANDTEFAEYRSSLHTPSNEVQAYLERCIEHAPPAKPSTTPNLRGWDVTEGLALCVPCATRIMGRNCHLPTGSEAIWVDHKREATCCLCKATI